MVNKTERCINCKHLRNLWYWEDYPRGKKYGYCCNSFNTKEDNYTLMQLYSIDGENDLCECFDMKDEKVE